MAAALCVAADRPGYINYERLLSFLASAMKIRSVCPLVTKLCGQGLDVLKVLNGPELAKASRKCTVF